MITIKNTQKKIKVNTEQLKSDAQRILALLHYSDFDLGIWLTSNATIRNYNREYRAKDKSTDILSFPYHPDAKPGKRIHVITEDDKQLGDLIIAPAYVLADAPQWRKTFEQRMRELLIHGILHLLGYDHITDAEFRVMRRKENEILKKIQE